MMRTALTWILVAGVLLTQALAGIRGHDHHQRVPGHHAASHVHVHDLIGGSFGHDARPQHDDAIDLPPGDQAIERPVIVDAPCRVAIAIRGVRDMVMSPVAVRDIAVRPSSGSKLRPVLRI
jgi:hypothetical protein